MSTLILLINILHNSQIGFLPTNRTADHVLALRTLLVKCVHHHNEKNYACFVDFKKAFDLVWHDGLLLPPQGFGPEAKTRGGTLRVPGCTVVSGNILANAHGGVGYLQPEGRVSSPSSSSSIL